MRGKMYEPVSLVTAVSGCSNVGEVNVTVTPGSTAPHWSVTLPKISPVCDWALVTALVAKSATSARTIARTLILPPPEKLAGLDQSRSGPLFRVGHCPGIQQYLGSARRL